jgi:uncharacterized protein involved in tolerance to divalent cations
MARWKPKRQETYYFINEYLKIKSYYWWEEREDNELYDVGNCFKTKEEAERALEKFKETLLKCQEEQSNG